MERAADRGRHPKRRARDVHLAGELSYAELQAVARAEDRGPATPPRAVETGTVFANLCATRGMSAEMRESVRALSDETLAETGVGAAQGLSDAVVWLEQGHRYAQGGAIGALVERVREGDTDAVLAWLAGALRG